MIRDLASSDSEQNKQNAKILSQNVFYHDLCCISQYALTLFDERKHSNQYLMDVVEYTHLMLEMLDEYSRGKVLTIQTQRKHKVKRKKARKNRARRQDDEFG